jgi:FKBP-type peptidyl-prolyl cis-trans isomerase FklB
MKRSLMCVALLLSTTTLACGQAPTLQTLNQKASYAIGLNIGRSMARDNISVDPALIAAGIADALSGAKPKLSAKDLEATMAEFQKIMQAKAEAASKAASGNAIKAGADFLAANKTKPGVKTLPSGLQYKVIKSGTGRTPKATDTVSTHYRGTLLNGTEFDSSYKRNKPASFPVNRVIPGWTEALQLMKEGDKWQLFIPSNLAYGANGPPSIGPNQTLLFDIELLEIK